MKRSRDIRLVLVGGLALGAMSGCDSPPPVITTGNVYTNNFQVPGVGFYHAPYRAWYPLAYNHFDRARGQYFHGGQWTPLPHQTFTNISEPTADAARQAEAQRTDVRRGGFGNTSRHHSTWS